MPWRRNDSLPARFLEIIALAVAYYVTARLCQMLAIPPGNVTPVWIPAGIALAAVLLRGYRVWPGIWLGAFAGNTWAYLDLGSLSSVTACFFSGTANGMGNVLSAAGGAYLIRRTTGTNNPFGSAAHVTRFIAFGVLLGPAVSTLFGVTSLCTARLLPWDAYAYTLLTWWTGHGVGALTVAPAVVVLATRAKTDRQPARLIEAGALAAVLLMTNACYLDFWHVSRSIQIPLIANAPILIWAVLRLDRRVVFSAVLVVSAMAVLATATGHGPFAAMDVNAWLIEIEFFIAVMAITVLMLSGVTDERERAEKQLKRLNLELKERVEQRTLEFQTELAERRRAEEALRESEQRFDLAAKGASDGLWDWPDVDRDEEWWSQRWYELLGYEDGEIAASYSSFRALAHPDDVGRIEEVVRAHFETRVPFDMEYRLRTKSGQYRWFRGRGQALWDEDGKPVRMSGSLQDVTNRKRAEEEVARLARFPSENPNPVLRISGDGTILYANHASTPLLAVWQCRVGEAVSGEWHELVRTALHGAASQPAEVPCADKVFSLSFAPVVDSGYVNVYASDVTDRKRVEQNLRKAQRELEQRVKERAADLVKTNRKFRWEVEERKRAEMALDRAERLASLGTLAAGIAHEINNPLNAIALSTEVLAQAEERSHHSQALNGIVRGIQEQVVRCGRIVKSVLQFARQETSEKWPCSLGDVIRRAQDLTRNAAADKGISISLELPQRLPELLMNPTEMEQVFVNLMLNAIQASRRGDCVTVRAESAADSVRVTVEDRGRGMTKEQADRAFDPFYTDRKQPGGTGLGLSIVHGIIEEHGGSIGVESTPRRGTAFTLVLPLHSLAAEGAGDGQGPDRG